MIKTTGKMPRVLVSANDPAAAFHLCEVMRHAAKAEAIEPILVAGPAALEVFNKTHLAARPSTARRVGQGESSGTSSILDAADTLISSLAPDAILVGLSGPDRGLDEALVARSGNIPTYALQDFWGDVNPGFGVLPDTYFVLDEVAAALTERRAPLSRVIVAGSARHAATLYLHADSLRDIFRSRIEVAAGGPIMVFFGQPLWHIAGYEATLARTAHALARVCPGALLLYRPHPKESLGQREAAIARLSVPGLSVAEDVASLVEYSLCGADLSFTCFSTCGTDLAYLSRASEKPLAAILFMLVEEDVRHFYRDSSGLDSIPLSTLGFANTVVRDDKIDDAIRVALTDAERARSWHVAREKIAEPAGAAPLILETILQDLGGRMPATETQATP